MNYSDLVTELKYYYAPPMKAELGPIKSAFVTTQKEHLAFHIHENDIYSITNMKTGELWTNVKLTKDSDGTLII